ncbi:MAG: adenine nucleotide alpha hydrolase family protein [Anaerolineae bacterium]|nr:adenine nucleotide alpha hydrolase family protein [Anaerolineae bacterium]
MSYIRCQVCGQRASIRMRQHRLNYCKDHFLEWMLKHTDSTIQKYRMFGRNTRVLVAISGGKDSLALWDILWRLGYHADGFYIDLGIDEGLDYSSQSRQFAEQFATSRNLALTVIDFKKEYGESIPTLAARTQRGKGKPCSICGMVKRHLMNQAAEQGGYSVVATGHNLDDEAAVLFSNMLGWNQTQLARQAPALSGRDGMAGKVKPLFRCYERETAAYAFLQRIAYIETECPFSAGSTSISYKHLLNQMEDRSPGTKMRFVMNYLKAKEDGFFHIENTNGQDEGLHPCPVCGQATSNPDMCVFCRTIGGTPPDKAYR